MQLSRTSVLFAWLSSLSIASLGCGGGSSSSSPGTAGRSGAAGTTGTAGTAGTTGTGGRGGTAATAGTTGGAGTTGAGGSGGSGGSSSPTAGCNAATWPMGGTSSPQMIDVTDSTGATTSRQFYFALPAGYSSATPVPVVYAWHYAGGTAQQIAQQRYYNIQPMFSNAIYVAPQGLLSTPSDATTSGWPNTNGQDIAFARAMIAWMNSNFCVDATRIMSTGMSYGGIMSHTVACQMSDLFRAVGIMSGAFFGGGRTSTCVAHPIAAWITHGDADTTVTFANGESARDRILATNHCGTTTHAVDPSPCVQYDGCDAGYPVVWCPVAGEGHTIPSFAAGAIATFFKQF
jgi:poly(3-hydroxybutyrate) depolymerase